MTVDAEHLFFVECDIGHYIHSLLEHVSVYFQSHDHCDPSREFEGPLGISFPGNGRHVLFAPPVWIVFSPLGWCVVAKLGGHFLVDQLELLKQGFIRGTVVVIFIGEIGVQTTVSFFLENNFPIFV